MRRLSILVVSCLVVCATADARVVPNSPFSAGAVLQRGMRVPVWGTAAEGERVTVTFRGQRVKTVAGKDGLWFVRLEAMRAGGPFTLTISGENTVTIPDVLVGEVWVCSGQSNMELPLWMARNADAAIAGSTDPMLHLYSVPHSSLPQPASDTKATWTSADPASVRNFSGVAYYFGRELRKRLRVPVGLIHSSVGGTVLQAWARKSALETNARARQFMREFAASKPPIWASGINAWGGLYNGMIAPLVPYAMRGVIWYQGEGNAGDGWGYRELLPLLIANWRTDWAQGDFPFLVVQIAPWSYTPRKPEPSDSAAAELREAQLLTSLHDPRAPLIVTMDVGDEKDIHPRDKETVGVRLALAARAVAYGERVEYRGPLYRSVKVEGSRIVLTFDHAGKGLVARGGELTGFTIAGADGKFANARATIAGRTVAVSSPSVPAPVAVRYGWADFPVANLFNSQGLPASPFRTDSFPIASQPR